MNTTASVSEAAKTLSMAPRALRELCLRVEASRGVEVMVRAGGQGKGARYRIDWDRLREHIPVLFLQAKTVSVDQVKQSMAGQVETLAEQVDSLQDEVRELRGRLRRLESRVVTPPKSIPREETRAVVSDVGE